MSAAFALPAAKPKPLDFLVEIAVNVGLPYALYRWAVPSTGETQALLISSLPPILWSLAEFVRRRRIDAISMLALGGILLSLAAFYGGGSVRMLQLREKLVTGIIGLAFLASAAIGRPALYEIGKAAMARGGSNHAGFVHAYGAAPFRRRLGLMTIVWGLGLLADVAVSAVLVFRLPVPTYLIVNPLLGYATMGGLALWSFAYARRHGLNGPRAEALMEG